jgi:uncharacterized protein YyaL (SSP411 family)
MPNRLADAQSPYLRQHKDNPVDWYPWGDAAFEKAKAEDKPIFLSIGYSTCHWCHVMAEESFEDETVAEKMNETFVSIKVDREERPDIDNLYMTVCQMMNRQGGWPLTIVMTPDKKPFFAATYLPKESRYGRMGMLDLIPRIRQLWTVQREEVEQEASSVTETLQRAADQAGGEEGLSDDILEKAYSRLSSSFDAEQGGFGSAPKFPAPHKLLFLLRYAHRTGSQRAQRMVDTTLTQMRRGGIFDHLGYGFHRYATDARWRVPHFEKMLYDQALLTMAYAEAYQATGTEAFAQTARETLTYVLRDLQAPEGGFYSAEDADSESATGEHEEGAYYVWTVDEVEAVLDEDRADLVKDVYNFREDGNYREESTGRQTGNNILFRLEALGALAEKRGVSEATLRRRLEEARQTLLAARDERPRPGLDDKILTDWNGLMIAGLAVAGRVLDGADYTQAARQAADFLLGTMRNADGRLLHRYRDGDAAIRAHLDDYAFLIWGLIELYQTTFEARWLKAAVALTEECTDHFADEERGGFYLTADDGEELLVRQKEFYDGARPSGNSIMGYNLVRLARLTGRTEWEEQAAALQQFAASQVRSQPTSFAGMLLGVDFGLGPSREVVIAGAPEGEDTAALTGVLRSVYTPRTVALFRDGTQAAADDPVAALAPFTAEQTPVDGQAAAYVCRDFHCQAPTTDPDALRQQLKEG